MTDRSDAAARQWRPAGPGTTAETSPTVAGGGRERWAPLESDIVEVEGAAADGADAAGPPSVAAWAFRPGAAPQRVTVEELPGLIADDSCVTWVDLAGHAAPDLRALAERLALHPAAVEAALASWQRPRLDVFHDQFRVSATVARLEAPDGRVRVRAGELDLFVRCNALLSAHRQPLPFGERVLARARQSAERPRLDAAYLLYVVLDELLHHTERLCEDLEDAVEAIEERALRDTADDFLDALLRLKRAVFALGRLVDQHREVFAAFLRPEFRAVAGEGMEPYFRDLDGRLDHLLGRLGAAKDSVVGAFDIFVSHVAHRTNQVMRLLTVVSTVLLPATVILGLFGTSFAGVPLYTRAAFVAMVLTILLVTGAILVAFRRRGWLRPG